MNSFCINILTFVTRVRNAPTKQSHTPSSKQLHLTRATCGTLPTTTGRTDGHWTMTATTGHDRTDGPRTDGPRTDDDDGTDGRTEDDDGYDGTDETNRTGPTDDIYSSTVSNTTFGPRFYRKSKFAVQKYFWIRTDISRWLAKTNITFLVDCARSQPPLFCSNACLDSQPMFLILIFVQTIFSRTPTLKNKKGYPMQNSELRLHLNCAFNGPCRFTHGIRNNF